MLTEKTGTAGRADTFRHVAVADLMLGCEEDRELLASWLVHMRSRALAERTRHQYLVNAAAFSRWLAGRSLAGVSRGDVETYLAEIVDRASAATAAAHYRTNRQLYRWLHVVAEEIDRDPFAGAKQPRSIDRPPPVLTRDELTAILSACESPRGASDAEKFLARRDLAIVRLFFDSGVRLGGLARLRVVDVDLAEMEVTVTEKGKERNAPFGNKTALALDTYLRFRRRHRLAGDPALWIGRKGPLSSGGVYEAVERRARLAGLDVNPHLFRHTVAHEFLLAGGSESDLMEIMGWSTSQMVRVYGRSARAARAKAAHARLGLGDRV